MSVFQGYLRTKQAEIRAVSHTLICSKINQNTYFFAINVIFHVQMLPKRIFVNGKLWRISEYKSPTPFILEYIHHNTQVHHCANLKENTNNSIQDDIVIKH